jgi:hypothetical protein
VFLTANGLEPGAELRLASAAASDVSLTVAISSIAPVDTLEIIVNGQIARTVPLDPAKRTQTWSGAIPMLDGGWVAARVLGPASRYVGDSFAFAQTSPVYVLRGDRKFVSKTDAKFLADVVEAIWARLARSPWRSDADRAVFQGEIEQARAVYLKLAGG